MLVASRAVRLELRCHLPVHVDAEAASRVEHPDEHVGKLLSHVLVVSLPEPLKGLRHLGVDQGQNRRDVPVIVP